MVRASLVFVLLALASNASAFFDPPTTSPTNPTAGQVVSVQFRAGGCDGVFGGPDDGEVALVNNVVNLTVDGGHAYDPIFCNYTIGVMTFRIGAFPEGEYVLNLHHRYDDFFGNVQTVLVGSTTFTVTGVAVHHGIPASSGVSPFLLVLAIALFGAWAAARHRAFGMLLVVLVAASLTGHKSYAQVEPEPEAAQNDAPWC